MMFFFVYGVAQVIHFPCDGMDLSSDLFFGKG